MRVEGNGLGRSAVAHVPACHNYSNGASGTVKRLRNRRLPAMYGNIQMPHLLSPNDAAGSCDGALSGSRPWAAPWRRRPQETDCRRADRMPRLLASLPVTELACAALVALTDGPRSCVGSSERDAAPVLSVAVLPAMAAKRASAPRGHLRTYLLSAHVSLPRAHPPGLPGCLLRAVTGPPAWSQGWLAQWNDAK